MPEAVGIPDIPEAEARIIRLLTDQYKYLFHIHFHVNDMFFFFKCASMHVCMNMYFKNFHMGLHNLWEGCSLHAD